MFTWHRGREKLGQAAKKETMSMAVLGRLLRERAIARVPGTGLFFTRTASDFEVPSVVSQLIQRLHALVCLFLSCLRVFITCFES